MKRTNILLVTLFTFSSPMLIWADENKGGLDIRNEVIYEDKADETVVREKITEIPGLFLEEKTARDAEIRAKTAKIIDQAQAQVFLFPEERSQAAVNYDFSQLIFQADYISEEYPSSVQVSNETQIKFLKNLGGVLLMSVFVILGLFLGKKYSKLLMQKREV